MWSSHGFIKPLGWLSVAGLLLWVSWAQAQKNLLEQNRTQVFVVAMSEDLNHQAGLITQLLRKVMQQTPNLQLLDIMEKLQPEAPEENRNLLENARKELKAAKSMLREMEYEAAVTHASQARLAFEKMGGYLDPLPRYQESILLVAVGEIMQGKVKEAESAFHDLLLLDPQLSLSKTAYQAFVIDLFNRVKNKLPKEPQGSLTIKTEPPGGNLYLGGQLKGVTPDSLDGLIAGNHLVVVKLAGYQSWGKVVRVEPGNLTPLEVKLVPGKAGGGFLQMVERAGRAISDRQLRGEVLQLGQALGLDWVWLCQLKHDAYDIVLTGYLFEFSQSYILYQDQLNLEASGYGMEEEVQEFGRRFMQRGAKALVRFREEGDPLAGHTGTEDWYRDDSEAAREHRESQAADENQKKDHQEKRGDPLDEIDGTEEW